MPKRNWIGLIPEPGNNWKPIDERKEDRFYFMKDFLKILKDFIDTPHFETSYDRREIIYQLGPSSEYALKGRAPYRPFPVSGNQPVDTEQKCEGVIYDVLAYYRQMRNGQSRNKNWGIYYVLRNIEDDLSYFSYVFNKYVKSSEEISAVIAAFLAYPALITFHELCHHTLELVRRIRREEQTYDPYDESLCEYSAFTLVENMRAGYPIYPPIALGDLIKVNFDQISGKISVVVPSINGRIKLETYVDHVDKYFLVSNPLSTLDDAYIVSGETLVYYLWNRHKMKPDTPKSYAPAVPSNYESNLLEMYWDTFRNQLILFGDHLDSYDNLESVWNRLGLDNRYIKDESDLCRQWKAPRPSLERNES
ncbi:hypothetical protein [Stygiolobus sp. CP8521M]|uniref:hypothetical protein n=1 Tax=Stygiolobus sp. CP8521M TaxID=3133136 RepID=UPI00307E87CC